jgi:HAD superfamily hydrolase (TIGR01509 family)
MTTNRQVTMVFWDLGGVILRTQNPERRRAWEVRLGLAEGDLARIVFDGPTSVEAMLGRASAEDVWASVGSRLGLTPVDRDRLRADFFAGDRIDEELMSFVRGLRPRARVGLISNAWPEVRRLLETTWGIADAFDPLVLSAEVGLVKPNGQIFHLALERAEVQPSHAVFVDDFLENVDAALTLGMGGVLFRTSSQAQEDVEGLLQGD